MFRIIKARFNLEYFHQLSTMEMTAQVQNRQLHAKKKENHFQSMLLLQKVQIKVHIHRQI